MEALEECYREVQIKDKLKTMLCEIHDILVFLREKPEALPRFDLPKFERYEGDLENEVRSYVVFREFMDQLHSNKNILQKFHSKYP